MDIQPDGKIYLGFPRERISFNRFIDNRDAIIDQLIKADRYCGYYNAEGHRVDKNRDGIVESFLNHKDEPPWLLMLDTDMDHPLLAPERLTSYAKPIVGALYFHRGEFHDPFIFKYRGKHKDKWGRSTHQWQPMRKLVYEWLVSNGVPMRDGAFTIDEASGDPLVECDAVATGCMLIHRSVLEKMKPPWFEYTVGGNSEDLIFCYNARKAGFPVYCDLSTVCGHYNWVAMGQAQFRMNYEGRGVAMSNYSKRQAANWLEKFWGISFDSALQKLDKSHAHLVGDYWKRHANGTDTTDPESLNAFYELDEVGKLYVLELLHWNFTPTFMQMKSMLTGIRNYNVIEIGAGIGSVALQLVVQENNVLAVEPNQILRDFIDLRWAELNDEREYDGQLSIVGNDWKDKCPDQEFDVVVSYDVFEHMAADELKDVLSNAGRVLKVGGKMIYHANWGQQDLYPMHLNHAELFERTCAELGFMRVNEMELMKAK